MLSLWEHASINLPSADSSSGSFPFRSRGPAHLALAHFRLARHHALRGGCAWSDLVRFLKLVSLQGLLVLNRSLRVLVALQDFVVLHLSQLKSFVHAAFELLAERVHFILLLSHQLGFCCQDFLVTLLHVGILLLLLHFVGPNLDLMRVLVVLLLGETLLDVPQVEQLSGIFEGER